MWAEFLEGVMRLRDSGQTREMGDNKWERQAEKQILDTDRQGKA